MWLTIVSFLTLFGGAGVPLGMPPAAEDVLMSRIAPDECVLYLSWAGMETPDPDSSNQTEQLLAEPEVQAMFDQIEQQITAGLRQASRRGGGREARAIVQDVEKWAKHLLTQPAAVFASRVTMGQRGPDVQGGALIKVGPDGAQFEATLLGYQAQLPPDAVEPVTIAGSTWHRITLDGNAPKIIWGVKGEYLLIGVGEDAIEDMLARARTPAPEWLTDLHRNLPVERVSSTTYINLGTLIDTVGPMGGPRVSQTLDAAGLANVSSLASVTGLDAEGFVSRTLLAIDGEPEGLIGTITSKSLSTDDLEMIPSDATIAVAASLDAGEILDAVIEAVGRIEPRAKGEILEGLDRFEEELRLDVRADLLEPLGDRWCFYNSPSQGGLVITGLTAVVAIDDPKRLRATHEKLLAMVRSQLGRHPDQPRIEQFDFEGQTIYMFNAREDDFPFCPSWCFLDDHLIVAPFPQNIKAILSAGGDLPSLAQKSEVASVFSSDDRPLMLAYADTPKLFELIYPFIPMIAQAASAEIVREGGIDLNVLSILPSAPSIAPHLRPSVSVVRRTEAGIEVISRQTLPGGNLAAMVPIGAALVVPAVDAARDAAKRAQSANSLKQIAFAMHNYHDIHKSFPPAYSTDDEGNPLLSWRVLILPLIEEQALYEQFHLDEPWDSPHNIELADRVVHVYCSAKSNTAPNKTNFLTIRGKDTVFPGKDGSRMRDISDGTSNTIMVVEAADSSAVIWTKPEDIEYDEDDPMAGLVGLHQGGFNAAFCDGSVRFLPEFLDPETVRRLLLRNDGEPIGDFELHGDY